MLSNGETINITYVKSVRARRLSVTVGLFKPVRVTFPARISLQKAQEFLESKLEWVKKAVEQMKKVELQTANRPALPKINKNNARVTENTSGQVVRAPGQQRT